MPKERKTMEETWRDWMGEDMVAKHLQKTSKRLVEENCRHGWPIRALIEGDPLSISLFNMIIGGEPISSS
ncbi:hypothetical protein NC651_001299 [Populus alba x Populus x berolinensis]|nr:hypothetical protein NC651_001299 [Populus alba x Populus x berolinensis]